MDLSDNISVEKTSVEAKMESLKQQIHTLQVRHLWHLLYNFLIDRQFSILTYFTLLIPIRSLQDPETVGTNT